MMINYCGAEYSAELTKLLRTVHPILKAAYHSDFKVECLLASECLQAPQ